jgi:protein gp37
LRQIVARFLRKKRFENNKGRPMENSNIGWTDHTFNPWIGCSKVSPGCTNCYAELQARKLEAAHKTGKLWGEQANRHVTRDENWKKPLRWAQKARANKTSYLVFCASMADVFDSHPTAAATRPRLFKLIDQTRCRDPGEGGLHWLLLTKRVKSIESMLPSTWGDGWAGVWLGVTIEGPDQAWRADLLRKLPAAVRFISYEPAIGPLTGIDLTGIHWLVAGGESGTTRREDNINWFRDIRDACQKAGTTFFFKQRSALHPGREAHIDGVRHYEWPAVAKRAAD